ncbi:MAG: TetR/AcrR family transcriptional regulator [Caldilineaceae bacterium]
MSFQSSFEHDQALFDAAIDEFVRQGYEQASINRILETAGMSKGQFYYHFKSKEGLYLALVEVLIAQKSEFIASVMQPADFQQDLFTILQRQIQHGLTFAQSHPAISRFSESFMREQGKPIYEKTLAKFNFQGNTGMEALIERAYVQGELRTDLPLTFVKAIVTFLFTHAVEAAGLQTSENVEEQLHDLIAFMKTGLERRPSGV